jgi:hypothetical protein
MATGTITAHDHMLDDYGGCLCGYVAPVETPSLPNGPSAEVPEDAGVKADGSSGVPDHVQEAAEMWQERHATYWKGRSLLLNWITDHGPVQLSDGRLCGFQPDGNAWDADGVKDVMPALIKAGAVTFDGSMEQVERLLSIALEEIPEINFKVTLSVDATAANAVIRAGGVAAEKLLPFRVAKNKLGVR